MQGIVLGVALRCATLRVAGITAAMESRLPWNHGYRGISAAMESRLPWNHDAERRATKVTNRSIIGHYSTNATILDGLLTFCAMKCVLFEPEALADFLRRGSASASGSKSQGFAMQHLQSSSLV